jgi:hypothetical protein
MVLAVGNTEVREMRANANVHVASNLAPTATRILELACEEAIALPYPFALILTATILSRAKSLGITEQEFFEALQALGRSRDVEVMKAAGPTGQDMPSFAITYRGFEKYARANVPSYDSIKESVTSEITRGKRTIRDISEALGQRQRLVGHILEVLHNHGLVILDKFTAQIIWVSPKLSSRVQ